jgi:hypothetical protein
VARVTGYAFTLDRATNQFKRKLKQRTRIIALTDANNMVNILPQSIDLGKLVYEFNLERKLVMTDGAGFSLDVNEFISSK